MVRELPVDLFIKRQDRTRRIDDEFDRYRKEREAELGKYISPGHGPLYLKKKPSPRPNE